MIEGQIETHDVDGRLTRGQLWAQIAHMLLSFVWAFGLLDMPEFGAVCYATSSSLAVTWGYSPTATIADSLTESTYERGEV